jgi:hypothetical protein
VGILLLVRKPKPGIFLFFSEKLINIFLVWSKKLKPRASQAI